MKSMFSLLRHNYHQRRDLLRQQIPKHFIPIICVISGIVYIPSMILTLFGVPFVLLIAQVSWVFALLTLMLLTFTGKSKYSPEDHRAARRVQYRRNARKRNPELRDITDDYIDNLYNL